LQVQFVVIETDRQTDRETDRFSGVFIVSVNTAALSHTNPTETPRDSCCVEGRLKRNVVSPYFQSLREHSKGKGQEVIFKLSVTIKILSFV
jgi:hypothetical protein